MDLIAGKSLRKSDGSLHRSEDALVGKSIVCFYFSAQWCPPCRQFTPILKEFYEAVQEQGLEIIFVSSDRSADDMDKYFICSHGDWLAAGYDSAEANALKEKFGVKGIPAVVVVKKDGTLITKDGRAAITRKGPMVVNEWL